MDKTGVATVEPGLAMILEARSLLVMLTWMVKGGEKSGV